MTSESCSLLALQDFARRYGMSYAIEIDNIRTEARIKCAENYRKVHTSQNDTELHGPCQNYAEHGAHPLSVIAHHVIKSILCPVIRITGINFGVL